jgi:hypothetical protein
MRKTKGIAYTVLLIFSGDEQYLSGVNLTVPAQLLPFSFNFPFFFLLQKPLSSTDRWPPPILNGVPVAKPVPASLFVVLT